MTGQSNGEGSGKVHEWGEAVPIASGTPKPGDIITQSGLAIAPEPLVGHDVSTQLEEDEPERTIPPGPLWAMKERRHIQWHLLPAHERPSGSASAWTPTTTPFVASTTGTSRDDRSPRGHLTEWLRICADRPHFSPALRGIARRGGPVVNCFDTATECDSAVSPSKRTSVRPTFLKSPIPTASTTSPATTDRARRSTTSARTWRSRPISYLGARVSPLVTGLRRFIKTCEHSTAAGAGWNRRWDTPRSPR